MFFRFFLATLLQTALLEISNVQVNVEIADTVSTRNLGLMDRSSLPEGNGMLFVYEEPETLSFWMKNTKIPLSIGFFDAERRLIQVEDMDPPKTRESPLRIYSSSFPAQYALEVPQHWFKKHKIPYGAKFTLHDLPQ